MIDESIDVIATFLVIVAPFALALFVIVLVIAYPWLLLIPLGFWYLVVKYGSDEVAGAEAPRKSQTDEPENELRSEGANTPSVHD